MTAQVIPLTGGESNAHQTISVQLGDYYLDLELHYKQFGQWEMRIKPNGDTDLPTFTMSNGEEYIATPVYLEPGMDLLGPFNLSTTLGQMYVYGDDPTLDNLGENNKLVWYSSDEVLSYS